MFAYIPARIGSKRIPEKNIKLLDSKPVLIHTIENLLKVPGLDGIAVSTDSEKVCDLISDISKVTCLNLRAKELSQDHSTFIDLVKYDLDRFTQKFKNDNVIFTLPTAALVSPHYFLEAITKFKNNPKGVVVSMTEYESSAYYAFSANSSGEMNALFPEAFYQSTQSIQKTYYDAGCFYLFDAKLMSKKNKFIDLNPIQSVILARNVGIDLDNPSDWERLEKNYFAMKREEHHENIILR